MSVIQLSYPKGGSLNGLLPVTEATGGGTLAIAGDTAAAAGVVAATATDTTAVAAAIAVLVADGASPTQAHVNTANAAWGTLLALINTLKTSATTTKTATAAALLTNGHIDVQIESGASKSSVLKGLQVMGEKIIQSTNLP